MRLSAINGVHDSPTRKFYRSTTTSSLAEADRAARPLLSTYRAVYTTPKVLSTAAQSDWQKRPHRSAAKHRECPLCPFASALVPIGSNRYSLIGSCVLATTCH